MSHLSPFWVTNHDSNADRPIAPKRNAVIPMVLGSVGLVLLLIFGLFYT